MKTGRVSPTKINTKTSLRAMKKRDYNLKTKPVKSIEKSLRKTQALKLNNKKKGATNSFLALKEKSVDVKIGKIAKNFLRDEYQYKGKRMPSETSLKHNSRSKYLNKNSKIF